MVLPSFKDLGARRRQQKDEGAPAEGPADGGIVQGEGESTGEPSGDSERTLTPQQQYPANFSLFFFISVIFLILTLIGNVNDKPVIRSTWFFKLNLSNIIPSASPSDLIFTNSLARSLGLHDFYQVGLWNFCEGYTSDGITSCSHPHTLYWFNPVSILLNELLSGATIALPANINNILDLIRIASRVMFGCFLTGVCMNFVSIFVAPVTLYSRWWEFPFAIWSFIAALLTTAGAIIGTVMFIIFRNVITSQAGLNIGAEIGTQMYAFMWVGAAFSIFGWIIHLCLICCCASRRDVKTGRRRGDKGAFPDGDAGEKEKKKDAGAGGPRRRMLNLGRKNSAGDVV
ncbi:SUR7 family protein [Lachnellula occidentalis]|uniref:SUR7 family protein n=1 Tax=Lachnellula occidentalis TaxID=215460 RepID=A0A8H8U3G4_9HELO|nr:SUR7 family protein [Lachnellula occidentalis]